MLAQIDLGSGCSRGGRARSRSARLIDSPPALRAQIRFPFFGWNRPGQVVRLISSLCFLNISLLSDSLYSLALPSLAAKTERAAAPFVTSSPNPLPATSIRQVCSPLLFLSAVRTEHPQTLTKLFLFGSESSYNILPTNFDFVCKNYLVYMCMLGPPLGPG